MDSTVPAMVAALLCATVIIEIFTLQTARLFAKQHLSSTNGFNVSSHKENNQAHYHEHSGRGPKAVLKENDCGKQKHKQYDKSEARFYDRISICSQNSQEEKP
jgi:hypothetical protein